jgi:2-iminobutanoate/2-iminopropanoate deaminase
MKRANLVFILLLAGCAAQPLDREVISTTNAPAAIAPYSQGIRVGNTLYVSGQIGVDPATREFVPGGISEQTHQVIKNIQAVLEAAGYSLADVVQSQVFLSDLNNYGQMNEVYGSYFKNAPPARAAVQVARLPKDALIEIMIIAVK